MSMRTCGRSGRIGAEEYASPRACAAEARAAAMIEAFESAAADGREWTSESRTVRITASERTSDHARSQDFFREVRPRTAASGRRGSDGPQTARSDERSDHARSQNEAASSAVSVRTERP